MRLVQSRTGAGGAGTASYGSSVTYAVAVVEIGNGGAGTASSISGISTPYAVGAGVDTQAVMLAGMAVVVMHDSLQRRTTNTGGGGVVLLAMRQAALALSS
jgi:hypothetical protein